MKACIYNHIHLISNGHTSDEIVPGAIRKITIARKLATNIEELITEKRPIYVCVYIDKKKKISNLYNSLFCLFLFSTKGVIVVEWVQIVVVRLPVLVF